MRRIITEVVDGRSRVLIDESVPQEPMAMLWDAAPNRPLGFAPAAETYGAPSLPPGHMSWRIAALPPDAEMRHYLAAGVPGVDADGFHTTATIDYVVILDGPVTLALDEGEIDLQPGDLVVQRATRHAWYNRTDKPIRLLALAVGIDATAVAAG